MAGAVENVNSVREKVRHRFERFDCPFGAAWQIKNQRLAASGGNRAREYGGRSFLQTLPAHFFRDSMDDAISDGLRGFRRIIARADTGAASRED